MSSAGERRRNQILDVANHLFISKGYQVATIEDILQATGIAKGTLYYHFKSKEEIMRAIIHRVVSDVESRARAVLEMDLPAGVKVFNILQSAKVQNSAEEMIEELHESANAEFHVLSITAAVQTLAPILAQAIEEGVQTGEFTSTYPLEDAEFILTSAFMLTDQGFFPTSAEGQQRRLAALVVSIGRILGTTLPLPQDG